MNPAQDLVERLESSEYIEITNYQQRKDAFEIHAEPKRIGNGIAPAFAAMELFQTLKETADSGSYSSDVQRDHLGHAYGDTRLLVEGQKIVVIYDEDICCDRRKVNINQANGDTLLVPPENLCKLAGIPYSGQEIKVVGNNVEGEPISDTPGFSVPVAAVERFFTTDISEPKKYVEPIEHKPKEDLLTRLWNYLR